MSDELMLDVGQANELKMAFRREGDWTNEKIKTLSERRGLLASVLDVLEGRSQITPIPGAKPQEQGIFTLKIDYGKSFEEMVASGHYDRRNNDLNEKRFPIKGEGVVEVEAKLFHFNRGISSEEAKRLIEEAGWQVAKTEHLLSYGAKYPDEQRKYPIVALGSVGRVFDDRYVPYLYRDDSERYLDLDWWIGDWDSYCRFLAVRNKVS